MHTLKKIKSPKFNQYRKIKKKIVFQWFSSSKLQLLFIVSTSLKLDENFIFKERTQYTY